MYIVTRTFRDSKGMFTVGTIVEPTDVKAFKSRLHQKHIVDVDEHNIDKWASFFKNRYGINLADKIEGYVEESEEAIEEEEIIEEPQLQEDDEPEEEEIQEEVLDEESQSW